jgi:hypothetical protein
MSLLGRQLIIIRRYIQVRDFAVMYAIRKVGAFSDLCILICPFSISGKKKCANYITICQKYY